ncbi:hypothetical protein [Edaphosphingomonas haloaromaticamans]|uniref:hypothetical protein n=1 Tax=Edaphosphingomonas haloaromaticamans TaxID=653954 RepID=UPI0020C76D0E|nr:hypothetical protein [Sphingomonas haloaromaticamans]
MNWSISRKVSASAAANADVTVGTSATALTSKAERNNNLAIDRVPSLDIATTLQPFHLRQQGCRMKSLGGGMVDHRR